MAKRHADASAQDPDLARQRTADMLRRLRGLTNDARALKQRILKASNENEERDHRNVLQKRARGRR